MLRSATMSRASVTTTTTVSLVQVLAGLLQLVSGMTPPHRHFSPPHKRVVWDYLWANGAHPFAPFGESATLSQAMVDVARRNAVLVRLDAALQSARAAVHEVDAFAQKHLYDPFAEGADHAAPTRVWVDRLFHQVRCACRGLCCQCACLPHYGYLRLSQSALKSPFANETITRLHNELEALAAQFVRAAAVLASDEDKALELSAAIASATAGAAARSCCAMRAAGEHTFGLMCVCVCSAV